MGCAWDTVEIKKFIDCSDIKNITGTQQLNVKAQDIISVSVERSRKGIYQDY